MRKLLNKLQKAFILFTGKIYLNKYFPFLVYNPRFHRIKGDDVRSLITMAQPGDLVFRSTKGYLALMFIPGDWDHVGVYIGDNKVIHSVGKKGVIIEDIITFFRADIGALVRINELTPEQIDSAKSFCKEALEDNQGYDYYFKDDNGRFYCSELVNDAFSGMFDHDRRKSYGVEVIDPQAVFDSNKVATIYDTRTT